MAFGELGELIEQHKMEITKNSAAEIQRQKLASYNNIELPNLMQLLMPTIEMIIRYLHHGDPAEYRDFLKKRVEQRIASGVEVEEILKVATIVQTEILKLVNQTYPSEDHAYTRQLFTRRIEGIYMLTNTAIVATRIKFNSQHS